MKFIVDVPDADVPSDDWPDTSDELWRSTVEQVVQQYWSGATVRLPAPMRTVVVMYCRRSPESPWQEFFDLDAISAITDGVTYDIVHTYRNMGYEVELREVELPR